MKNFRKMILTQHSPQRWPVHFSSRVSHKHKVFRCVHSDGKEPKAKYRAGRGGGPSVSSAGRDRDPLAVRTSPSHLFFPFLQAVHARAPRFGI
jgi:hypothetical protein